MADVQSHTAGNSTYRAPLDSDGAALAPEVPDENPFEAARENASEDSPSAKIRASILLSVKDSLGLVPEYDPFDNAIIMHINSVFGILFQLGVGSETEPFQITGDSEQWSDFECQLNTEFVRSYMYMKVRLLFDPPTTATMYDAFSNQIRELEWRLRVAGDEDRYLQNGRMDLIYGQGGA